MILFPYRLQVHGGAEATKSILKEHQSWKEMLTDISNVINECIH